MIDEEFEIPRDYCCPISGELMEDPVVAEDGQSYERELITQWFQREKKTSPVTGAVLASTVLFDNYRLKSIISNFKEKMPENQRYRLSISNLQRKIEAKDEEIKKLKEELAKAKIDLEENKAKDQNKIQNLPSFASKKMFPIGNTEKSNSQLLFQPPHQDNFHLKQQYRTTTFWCCVFCQFKNKNDSSICSVCTKKRPELNQWVCELCNQKNNSDRKNCAACGKMRKMKKAIAVSREAEISANNYNTDISSNENSPSPQNRLVRFNSLIDDTPTFIRIRNTERQHTRRNSSRVRINF